MNMGWRAAVSNHVEASTLTLLIVFHNLKFEGRFLVPVGLPSASHHPVLSVVKPISTSLCLFKNPVVEATGIFRGCFVILVIILQDLCIMNERITGECSKSSVALGNSHTMVHFILSGHWGKLMRHLSIVRS